jgi:hypothetical protein
MSAHLAQLQAFLEEALQKLITKGAVRPGKAFIEIGLGNLREG